jgi:hypothetical protein
MLIHTMRPLALAFGWTLATCAGFLLAVLVGVGTFLSVSAAVGCGMSSVGLRPGYCTKLDRLDLLLAGLVGGAVLGLTQFAILRLFRAPVNAWWIPCTGLGLAIPVTIEAGFTAALTRLGQPFFFAATGLALGLAQWLALRRLPKSAMWVAASLLSAVLGGLCSGWQFESPLTWLIFGAGTSLALVWFLRPTAVSASQAASD